MSRSALVSPLFVALFCALPLAAHAVAVCPAADTLEALVACLKDSEHMPRSGSGGFVPPTPDERLDWAGVVTAMLDASAAGTCAGVGLPSSLAARYEVSVFTDAGDGARYCVLAELALVGQPAKTGWGTFITRLHPDRELAIQIPHPLHDSLTPEQGIGVFQAARARSFLLAGTHRFANDVDSVCQSSSDQNNEADAAHNLAHMFAPTTEATLAWYRSRRRDHRLVVLQFHAMADTTCPGVDVYLTYGRPPGSGTPIHDDDLLLLEAEVELRHPDWTVVVPGESPACGLHGSTNTQGRVLNGVDAPLVCATHAVSYSGRFIHVEQTPGHRLAADWIEAILATWRPTDVFRDGFESGNPACWSSIVGGTSTGSCS